MAKTSTQTKPEGGNAYSGVSSEAPPRFVEFAGVRAYSYAAQALLKLAERAPDSAQATQFICAAALVDQIRYSGMPRRPKAQES